MNKIKALFFDIDGTLVSFATHAVPQSALDAIHRVQSMGVKVFIATGRPMPFIDNLGSLKPDGIIAFTGAHCELCDGTVIRHTTIHQDDVRRMIAHHQEHDTCVSFATRKEVISTPLNADAEEVYKLLDVKNARIASLSEVEVDEVIQMIPFFTKDEEPYFMQEILPHCFSARWHPAFVDVISQGNSKSVGIDAVINHLGIDISETAAFGDGGNDIDMLQHVAVGVAMGNAGDEVKRVADIVTDTVDNDGVAKALAQLFP